MIEYSFMPTLMGSFHNLSKSYEKASIWFEDNKSNIFTTKTEAIDLYMMGLDCTGMKPDSYGKQK